MTKRILSLCLALLLVTGLLGSSLFAGGLFAQPEATDQQATLDALINERFTQTAAAVAPMMTATADAAATAALQLTVDAAFNRALTATAQANIPADSALEIVLFASENPPPAPLMQRAASIIQQRLEGLGLSPVVVVPRPRRIIVRIPAGANLDEVTQTITQPGLLEFVNFDGQGAIVAQMTEQRIATTGQLEAGLSPDPNAQTHPTTGEPFETILTGAAIQTAEAAQDTNGQWGVNFELNNEAAETFGAFTEANIGQPIGIVLDGVLLSAPIVQARLDNAGVIVGNFTEADAERLALQLRFGALPLPLTFETVRPIAEIGTVPTPVASGTPTPGVTPTPGIFPTVTTGEVQVAEQVFERGRMFWIQPVGQIWVLEVTEEGGGAWTVYEDTFQEGEAEFDPSIIPPEGLFQPERGFGKVWREQPGVRETLGWAVTPEFGYTSRYEYHPGGTVESDQYVPGPGFHVLFSLYDEAFRFNEADSSWELNTDEN